MAAPEQLVGVAVGLQTLWQNPTLANGPSPACGQTKPGKHCRESEQADIGPPAALQSHTVLCVAKRKQP